MQEVLSAQERHTPDDALGGAEGRQVFAGQEVGSRTQLERSVTVSCNSTLSFNILILSFQTLFIVLCLYKRNVLFWGDIY